MIRFLTWFVRLWIGAVIALNVLAIVGMIVGSPTLNDAWLRVTDTYSPFNLWTHGLNLVLISPAIGAYFLHEKLRERAAVKVSAPDEL